MGRDATRGARVLRGILAVVAGYLVYAFATMGVVWLWFIRPAEPPGLVGQSGAAVSIFLVAQLTATAVGAAAGPVRAVATRVVAVLVALVCFVNLALGVAIEPPWFTALALVVVPLVLIRSGRVAP